jgi:GT2 family glycosyltransferase
MLDLSIITVPWNVKDLARKNFKAIYKNTSNIEFEIISVDNDSKDGTTEMIKKEFPEIIAIHNDHNAGFAKANNQGIKISKGRYVLLLNPDMEVKQDTLLKMVEWMDKNQKVGVAGCKLIKPDGEIVPHVRSYPKLFDQIMIILKVPHLFPGVLNKYMRKDFDYNKEQEVDSIRGSFFMIRREILDKLGGLDERYFIWFEEVDFCRQVKEAGYKVMYTPITECIDYVGKSFAQVPGGKLQDIFKNSMLVYFKKWHSPLQFFILKSIWPIGKFIAWLGNKIKFKKRQGVN